LQQSKSEPHLETTSMTCIHLHTVMYGTSTTCDMVTICSSNKLSSSSVIMSHKASIVFEQANKRRNVGLHA